MNPGDQPQRHLSADERPALVRFCAVGAAILAVIGTAVVLGADDDRLALDEARLTVDGAARVDHPDGTTEPVTGTSIVRHGDVITAERGTYELELANGTELGGRVREVREGEPDKTALRLDREPELLKGDLLVVASQGLVLEADGNDIQIDESNTAAKLYRGFGVRVATYQGSLTLESAGQRRPVPALRAMQVAVLGRPPARPVPLPLDPSDPWDQRFLGSAIALTERLDSLAAGYSATLSAGEGRSAGFYQRVLPVLATQVEFGQPLVDALGSRGRGEILVGATIAALGRLGSFVERWTDVFDFRDEGAAWGLVALDQHVNEAPLVGTIEAAIGLTPFGSAVAAPIVATSPAPTTDTPSTPTTAPSVTSPSPTTPTNPVLPPTTLPPPTPTPTVPDIPGLPPLPPLPPLLPDGELLPPTGVALLDQLLDPVDALLGGLLTGTGSLLGG